LTFESNTAIFYVVPAMKSLARSVVSATFAIAVAAPFSSLIANASANPAQIGWQPISNFSIARTETTVGQFRKFAIATKFVTRAEKSGGGEIYENGWVKKSGWNWQTPFGDSKRAADDEPAAHIAFDEAQAFCKWASGALPTDAQWVEAAYTERRANPAAPFARGKTYAFPTGDSPTGAQCLGDCGAAAKVRAINHGATLLRGDGHARTGTSAQGVNGLYDMGGNLWEWIDEPSGTGAEKRTRGGSWWYGAAQMKADYLQSKPVETTVAYIGFRCAKPSP
jgi:formylglycine-generating enzyme